MPADRRTPDDATRLPSFDESYHNVFHGNATALERFIYDHEPEDTEGEKTFRVSLRAVIAEAERRGAAAEREACAEVAEAKYAEPGWCGDYKTAAATIAELIRSRAAVDALTKEQG